MSFIVQSLVHVQKVCYLVPPLNYALILIYRVYERISFGKKLYLN